MVKKLNYTGTSKPLQRICEVVNSLIDEPASSIETTTMTLRVNKWSANLPYRYDLGVDYANRNVIIGIDMQNLTTADYELIGKFVIVGGVSGRYLYANQWRPSMDIPVIIQYSEGKE